MISLIGNKNFLHDTVSLCNTCYRHISGQVYEQNGKIILEKECKEHGVQYGIQEIDVDFFNNLQHIHRVSPTILFEITDRCNLQCPHCYHLPDDTQDKPISDIITQLQTFPSHYYYQACLAGAEPTLRKDLNELCGELKNKIKNISDLTMVTNGIKFQNLKFTKEALNAGLDAACIGLNHWSYQGQKVHDNQLKGIRNLKEAGLDIGYIGYTLESLNDMEEVLEEIGKFDDNVTETYRIRCGSFIGRSSDNQRSYLSSTYAKIKEILGDDLEIPSDHDNNPYHIVLNWGNKKLRVIQWPDVTNIDMEELISGPYCHFNEGPVTNLVHQIIIRDAFKNMNLPVLDTCPERYHFDPEKDDYWRNV